MLSDFLFSILLLALLDGTKRFLRGLAHARDN